MTSDCLPQDGIRLGLDAMRTHFEVVLPGINPTAGEPVDLGFIEDDARDSCQSNSSVRLRAAAEAALEEISSVEQKFNFYHAESWLSKINREAGKSAVRVPPDVFELLELCASVHRATDGSFDPSIATQSATDSSSSICFDQVQLSSGQRSVRFLHPNIKMDLGGVAKGWAIDRAIEVLQEAEITSALIHGGTSSMRSIGTPPNEAGWKIAIGENACTVLTDQALSVSNTFAGGDTSSTAACHIIHPRTKRPLRNPRQAAVICSSAALADAWSTALLVDASTPFTWKQIP